MALEFKSCIGLESSTSSFLEVPHPKVVAALLETSHSCSWNKEPLHEITWPVVNMERSRFSFHFSISVFFFLSFFSPFTLSFMTDKSGRQGRN